jgi:hypothetical protein
MSSRKKKEKKRKKKEKKKGKMEKNGKRKPRLQSYCRNLHAAACCERDWKKIWNKATELSGRYAVDDSLVRLQHTPRLARRLEPFHSLRLPQDSCTHPSIRPSGIDRGAVYPHFYCDIPGGKGLRDAMRA